MRCDVGALVAGRRDYGACDTMLICGAKYGVVDERARALAAEAQVDHMRRGRIRRQPGTESPAAHAMPSMMSESNPPHLPRTRTGSTRAAQSMPDVHCPLSVL